MRNFGTDAATEVVGTNEYGDTTRLADKLAEDAILEEIEKIGDASVDSEESGHLIIGKPKIHWVVDPLDGSSNFSRNIPFFAVSILLEEVPGYKPVAAVVHEPAQDRTFYADRSGAYLDSRPISAHPRTELEDCLFCLDLHFGKNDVKIDNFLRRIRALARKTTTFRSIGSVALALCYTAAGSLDGFLDISKNSRFLDIAAGAYILEQSGGTVTDSKGQKPSRDYDMLIAASSLELNRSLRSLIATS